MDGFVVIPPTEGGVLFAIDSAVLVWPPDPGGFWQEGDLSHWVARPAAEDDIRPDHIVGGD